MDNIKKQISDGDVYGGLQTLKALLLRSKKKQDREKVDNTGINGAILLLGASSPNDASDLLVDLVEIWQETQVPADDQHIEMINKVSQKFLSLSADLEPGKHLSQLLDNAIYWSQMEVPGTQCYKHGHPKLKYLAVQAAIVSKDLKTAQKHFIYAAQPEEFAKFTFKLAHQGYAKEIDLFPARSILELLATGNLKDANLFFKKYVRLMEDNSQDRDLPLINFCEFLLKTLERDALPLFKVLREKYAPGLRRIPNSSNLLDQVAEQFFDVKVQKTGMAAMMDSMMGMFAQPPRAR